jgi:hypothetical protein
VQAGVFPFFSVDLAGGWTNSVQFHSDGTVTVTSTCKAGNPQILGVLVTSIHDAVALLVEEPAAEEELIGA